MFKRHQVVLAVSAALVASSATAGLTINPSIRNSVVIESDETSGANETSKQESRKAMHRDSIGKSLKGRSKVHGSFEIAEEKNSTSKVYRFGENAPLFFALEKVIPNSDDWDINIDSGLENTPVSWDGGETWEGVLEVISNNNGVSIVVSHSTKAIGVSRDPQIADAMAARVEQVYKLDGAKSLRKNLDDWAKAGGYKEVVFSREVYDIDYPVFDAVFIGKIDAKGGAIDQLFMALNENAKTPLSAAFRKGNGVILIGKLKSKKEMY